ncbi:ribosomal RNA adenine dimethylase domain-containing protein [Sarocladium implicatum]|nr:ribosomal RNA adenine dimethylase domain-containing protein [Sarocladium implicatum]
MADDVLAYMGQSLDRHVGCDLVDLNPGSGLWSRKLHERLQPRKHILMESDAELYNPFLSDLTAKENVELIPKSGIVWKNLTQMLETRLDSQSPRVGDGSPERNDTLLVTANLATNPIRKIFGYDSISTMVLHQFISSIHFSSLFQRYGRVRLLIWTNDEDKRRILPRSLSRRKRLAFQTELACEWLHEVVGLDNGNLDTNYLRDDWINIESAYATLQRMQSQNLVMPPGREPQHHLDALADPSLIGKPLAGMRPPIFKRPFLNELEGMRSGAETDADMTDIEAKQFRIRAQFLASREKIAGRDAETYLGLLQTRDALYKGPQSMSASEFERVSKAWLDEISILKKNAANEFALIRDNYHLFRQPEPVMLWDRRAFEPLVPQPDEFFPRSPCTLFDIQPKAMNPLFLQHGPSSTRSGDMADIMLRAWFSHLSHPAPHAMHAVWAGFGDFLDHCRSFVDPALGGSPIPGPGALTARSINETQWTEVVEAWMDWPFRPEYTHFLGRTLDEPDSEDDDPGALGAFES